MRMRKVLDTYIAICCDREKWAGTELLISWVGSTSPSSRLRFKEPSIMIRVVCFASEPLRANGLS
jgi:hypothetical protein